ncbi:MAG: universal stress protein [Deltaproteobacteria bacterium]|nr:universal stress protein [Deltaproteobacteria bacterium]
MISKIVVGVDGSDGAMQAARMAVEIATKFEAKVLLQYVIPPVTLAPELNGAEVGIDESNRRAAEAVVAELKKALQKPALAIDTAVAFGPVAETLADTAAAQNANLLVVGSRGRGVVARVLLGSVADRLGHICNRPLLIVHGAKAP